MPPPALTRGAGQGTAAVNARALPGGRAIVRIAPLDPRGRRGEAGVLPVAIPTTGADPTLRIVAWECLDPEVARPGARSVATPRFNLRWEAAGDAVAHLAIARPAGPVQQGALAAPPGGGILAPLPARLPVGGGRVRGDRPARRRRRRPERARDRLAAARRPRRRGPARQRHALARGRGGPRRARRGVRRSRAGRAARRRPCTDRGGRRRRAARPRRGPGQRGVARGPDGPRERPRPGGGPPAGDPRDPARRPGGGRGRGRAAPGGCPRVARRRRGLVGQRRPARGHHRRRRDAARRPRRPRGRRRARGERRRPQGLGGGDRPGPSPRAGAPTPWARAAAR